MNLTKLTEKAQEALVAAQQQAESRHNTQFEPEHLLLPLIKQDGGVVPAVLEKLGVSPGCWQSAPHRLSTMRGTHGEASAC